MISFGFLRARQPFQLLIVQQPVVAPDAVLHGAEPLARQIGRRAVGQVAAGGEAHAQDRVARLQQGEERRLVRLRARMRLHVGERAGEQPLRPVDRELLGDVHIVAAAVVAPARVALGIFVGQHGALRLQHRGGDGVLAGDQLDAILLADQFGAKCCGQLRVGLGERGAEEPLAETDPDLAAALGSELIRQQDGIELIASENAVSAAVLEAQGSVLTNKYAEGYPGRRYYGGCEYVDVAERLAIDRAKRLFSCTLPTCNPIPARRRTRRRSSLCCNRGTRFWA